MNVRRSESKRDGEMEREEGEREEGGRGQVRGGVREIERGGTVFYSEPGLCLAVAR